MAEKETLSDKIVIGTYPNKLKNLGVGVEMCITEDVKEFIQKCENDMLDLSILEINKDLTISELVEKAVDKIRERAGAKLT